MRLFVAAEISEEVKKKLAEVQKEFQSISQFFNKVKWVKAENFHLTLKFLGEVREGNLNELTNALVESVKDEKKFELEIQGLGAFPSPAKPRVLWAGIQQGTKELKKIADQVEKNSVDAGFAPRDAPFSPHLTLARFPSFPQQLMSDFSKKIETNRSFFFGKTTVSKIVLFQSLLSPAGPHYSVLEEFPFPCN